MQYVPSPNMKSQNNKIVLAKKKWRLKCGWQKEQNSCASLFQEQILKDKKKRHKYYQISFQSFPVSVLVLRFEPFSDPLLEILKQKVRGHKRESLIETCGLDEAFVIREAHTVGVHRAGSLGISFTHCDFSESQCQVALSFDGTRMCHV